jgi:signal peptidase II
MKIPGRIELLWISALIIILDQVSKQVALKQLPLHRPVSVMPGLDWFLTFNPGAAFSFLADAGGWQRWFFTITTIIISTVILIWIGRLQKNETVSAISLCLIFGGAIGNLIDRVNYGYVIDFIQVWLGSYPWPAFNVADAAISVGAVILLLTSFRQEPKDQDSSKK